MTNLQEEWRGCEDYPGLFVSNLGRVKRGGRILKQYQEPQGYMRVHGDTNSVVRVHTLVAKAFLPFIMGKTQVDHKDENKANNIVTNLRWVTSKENTELAGKSGKLSRKVKKRAIVAVNVDTLEVGRYASIVEAERQLGVDNRNIGHCLRKHRLSTGGYKFYYEEDWRALV